jgi:Rrf2 family protein
MRASAKVDYALRAGVELGAAQHGADDEASRPVEADTLARAQEIPLKFLENILQGLRQAGLVESRRGHDGGHPVTLAGVAYGTVPDRVLALTADPGGWGKR